MVLKPDGKMLEICCGDGFNARHFYSSKASSIIAIDFDRDAIPHAKRFNSVPNVTYLQKDIREGLPAGPFDNIVWDAAIEHFSEEEIDSILKGIRRCLNQGGVLAGYTILEGESGTKHIPQHEREFKNKEDLLSFFKPTFPFVEIFETVYPSRTNLYFYASDREESIPFASRHPRFLRFPTKETTSANQP